MMNRAAAIGVTIITGLLLVAVAVTGVFLSYYVDMSNSYARNVNTGYEQAYYQLADNLSSMQTNLNKARVVRGRAMLSEILMDTAICCEGAGQALYKFSSDGYSTTSLTKFTNQVGDYCSYLHDKAAEGREITSADYSTLDKLAQVTSQISDRLAAVKDSMGKDGFEFSTGLNEINAEFSVVMDDLQDGAIEYPSLIYDGPFSDGLDDIQAKSLSGEEITAEQGAAIIARDLGKIGIGEVSFTGENTAHFPTYMYSVENEHGSGDVQITRQGGKLVQFSFNCNTGEKREFDAEEEAIEFCRALGLKNMKPVWQTDTDGIIYMNLCYEDNGVVIYPDMVKVKINSEDGHVIGYEALSYIFNHTERNIEQPAISEQAVLERDWGEMTVKHIALTVIPTGGGGERLTYEVEGFVGETEFFVYIDAANGEEVKVLTVVDSEQGRLLI